MWNPARSGRWSPGARYDPPVHHPHTKANVNDRHHVSLEVREDHTCIVPMTGLHSVTQHWVGEADQVNNLKTMLCGFS